MRWSAFLLLALMVFAASRPSTVAAAAPVLVEQRLEAPDDLTVGDRFRLVVRLDADPGTTIAIVPASLPPQIFLTQRPVITSSRTSGREQLRIEIELAAFAPGDHSVPGVKLAYQDPTGGRGELDLPPFTLSVVSVLPPDGDLAPRDLKPQLRIPTSSGSPWPTVAAVLVVISLIAGALAYWRSRVLRRRSLLAARPTPVLIETGPEDIARARLDEAGAAFVTTGDYVVYYSAIAVTVRNYLAERFGFPAFALTTSELQDSMANHGIDRWQARLVTGLLQQCDAVIFAGYRPAHERADADLTAAYEIVEMSRPAPRVPEEAVTA